MSGDEFRKSDFVIEKVPSYNFSISSKEKICVLLHAVSALSSPLTSRIMVCYMHLRNPKLKHLRPERRTDPKNQVTFHHFISTTMHS